jgi:hypothetical protein
LPKVVNGFVKDYLACRFALKASHGVTVRVWMEAGSSSKKTRAILAGDGSEHNP